MLYRGLGVGLRPWRLARAIHGPGKLLLDLATAITLRGDCLADIGVVRAKEQLFGPVASDPTRGGSVATAGPRATATAWRSRGVPSAVSGERAEPRPAVGRQVVAGQDVGARSWSHSRRSTLIITWSA